MTNYLRVDHEKRRLVMDRTFAKYAAIAGSDEYKQLQECRRDYPNYTVTTRHIKTNPNKECYKGLTYGFMEDYILMYEPQATKKETLDYFRRLRTITSAHSEPFRYPVIKKWFLERYPEFVSINVPELSETKIVNVPFEAPEEKAAS